MTAAATRTDLGPTATYAARWATWDAADGVLTISLRKAARAAGRVEEDAYRVEEEDAEQGFRAYEFMGLDIILDTSHCACARCDAAVGRAADAGG
jgi:hypothetical protein